MKYRNGPGVGLLAGDVAGIHGRKDYCPWTDLTKSLECYKGKDLLRKRNKTAPKR